MRDSSIVIVLESHFYKQDDLAKSYPFKNKLVNATLCGVEELVGLDRRGNLNYRQEIFHAFLNFKYLKINNLINV